jgi:hypothetical protein
VYERFVMRLRDKLQPPVAGFTIRTAESAKQAAKGAQIRIDKAQEALDEARENAAAAAAAAPAGAAPAGAARKAAAAPKKKD